MKKYLYCLLEYIILSVFVIYSITHSTKRFNFQSSTELTTFHLFYSNKKFNNILESVSPFFLYSQEGANMALLEKLEDEIREDYLFSVKKAIVNFIINDPSDKQQALGGSHITCDENNEECKISESRKELDIVPKPWHSSFLSAYRFCQRNLFVTNTCMLQLLDLWHTTFA
ncbi:unnamed protein product [Trichobilharzia regenti]|nr:unnamed protein product [Trichobilharzia regenti]